jgi:hypothetical protein
VAVGLFAVALFATDLFMPSLLRGDLVRGCGFVPGDLVSGRSFFRAAGLVCDDVVYGRSFVRPSDLVRGRSLLRCDLVSGCRLVHGAFLHDGLVHLDLLPCDLVRAVLF